LMSTGSESTGIDCQGDRAQHENPQPEVPSSSKDVDSEYIVYLTLGDGDFTYSLDLARYLNLSLASSSTKQKRAKLILTGVDTLDTLTSKYKDSKSILQEIRNQQDETPSISLTIRHGVNAIVHPNEKDDLNERVHEAADHVLFHHPHLGTENCSLHKHFLAHLFHSVKNYWMKRKGGIFHLTLVEGQYERWKCQEQAERHELELLGFQKFAPPPVMKTDGTNSLNKNGIRSSNRYHYRRHQTGKSFASRRPNSKSITYTFGRTIDKGMYITTTLPWQTPGSSSSNITTRQIAEIKTRSLTAVKSSMLLCSFCDKEFLEKRSLKCHLRDKHQGATATQEQEIDGQEQPRKKKKMEMGDMSTTIKTSEISSFSCLHCQLHRVFQSEKALQSHIRAKHSGICTYIAPDWSIAKMEESRNIDIRQPDGEPNIENDTNKLEVCYICGFKLIGRNLSHHFADFLPVDGLQTFSCDFCSKLFREERAKLQHMNFCSKRSI
jgi:hypothetical protein